MESFTVDIIVPVWNRPVETRACLVGLLNTCPTARLILIDNGCDRESERLLEEFAELLGERALFLKNSINQGFVRAINRGLARAEAPYAIVVRNTTTVTDGWLEPMLELADSRAEVGLIVPQLLESAGAPPAKLRRRPLASATEIGHGSFAAMLIRKELFACQGGFDEGLDGALWCLKDYSRRSLRHGYLTCTVAGSSVICVEEAPLGSLARRQELERHSAAVYEERWGGEESFCLCLARDADPEEVRREFTVILRGARMGHRFVVLAQGKLYRLLHEHGYGKLHRTVALEKIPRFFAAAETRKLLSRLFPADAQPSVVADMSGGSFPGIDNGRPFAWLEERLAQQETHHYLPVAGKSDDSLPGFQ